MGDRLLQARGEAGARVEQLLGVDAVRPLAGELHAARVDRAEIQRAGVAGGLDRELQQQGPREQGALTENGHHSERSPRKVWTAPQSVSLLFMLGSGVPDALR